MASARNWGIIDIVRPALNSHKHLLGICKPKEDSQSSYLLDLLASSEVIYQELPSRALIEFAGSRCE